MRAILVLGLACIPACVDRDSDDQPPYTPPPPSFTFDKPSAAIGVGLAYTVPCTHDATITAYSFSSSSPAVRIVIDGDNLVLHADAAGAAVVQVTRANETDPIASLPVGTVDIDHTELYFRNAAVSATPVTTVAAILGSDSLDLGFRSATNRALDGEATVTITGDAVALAEGPEIRLSDLFTDHQHVPVEFRLPGTAQLVVQHDGHAESFPIEVVAAPDSIELVAIVLRNGLVVAPSPVDVGEPVGIDLVARMADGRFVAGVIADWNVDARPWSNSLAVTELVFSKDDPGTATITATVGSTLLTTTVTAN